MLYETVIRRRARATTAHRTLAHPGLVAGVAGVAFVGSYAVARRDHVPAWEIALTRWFNGAPDWQAHALWPVMQLGALWGPFVVAAAIVGFRRDWLLAGVTVATGTVTWFTAKGIKTMVERGRPRAYIADIVVREGKGTGLGFPSGHAAVAAATAVLALAALPRRARPIAVLLAFLVGIARIVYGVHLPADVIGGWAFGTLMGLIGLSLVDAWNS